jgi:hypothetical protein
MVDGLNVFTVVGNNPCNGSDPMGLWFDSEMPFSTFSYYGADACNHPGLTESVSDAGRRAWQDSRNMTAPGGTSYEYGGYVTPNSGVDGGYALETTQHGLSPLEWGTREEIMEWRRNGAVAGWHTHPYNTDATYPKDYEQPAYIGTEYIFRENDILVGTVEGTNVEWTSCSYK